MNLWIYRQLSLDHCDAEENLNHDVSKASSAHVRERLFWRISTQIYGAIFSSLRDDGKSSDIFF